MLPMWVAATFAAVLVGSMLHLNSQMTSMGVQMQHIGLQALQMEARMTSLGAQVQQIGVQALQVEARMGAQVQQIGLQALQMEARLVGQAKQMEARIMVRYEVLDARFDRLTASVDRLLVSTLTPAAAQATLACAQASVYILFLFIDTWNHTLGKLEFILKPCSAFSYAKLKGGDTLVVSAAHCFTNNTQTTIDATRLALAREARVICRLLESLPTSDSALLRCEDAPPLLRRASSAPVFAQAVVAAGFYHENFPDPVFPPPLSVHNNFAMHVLTSTIAVSMGPGAAFAASGGGLSGGGLSLPTHMQPPFGVLQGMALLGMSGGPVLDVHCGVVGIISRRSTNTAFAYLDEVDAWVMKEVWM
jgi:hypothetical protein